MSLTDSAVSSIDQTARRQVLVANQQEERLSIPTKTFNIDIYRRQLATERGVDECREPDTPAGRQIRIDASQRALDDLMSWLRDNDGSVGVLDGPSVIREHRKHLVERAAENGISVIFIESNVDKQDLIMKLLEEVHNNSPEYRDREVAESKAELDRIIKMYENMYEPLDEDGSESHYSYCKLFNVGENVIINRVRTYLESKILYYTISLHTRPRTVWLSRHGESMFNVEGKIGGDSELSPRGREYATALPDLLRKMVGDRQVKIWTSTMKRTIETAKDLPFPKLQWKALDELDAGLCDGLTYDEIGELYPEDLARRDDDKYNARYQCGESYSDAVIRIEPVIMELERQENVFIVCHQAVIRCIYGFFHNLSQEELPYIDIPLHTIIKLTPRPYSVEEERLSVPIDAVSTYRPRISRKKDANIAAAKQPPASKNDYS